MKKIKELKTCEGLNKKLKETYDNLKLHRDKMYTLKIDCNSFNGTEFKYYFEIDKNEIPIYKRGMNSNESSLVHSLIYKILLYFFNKGTFDYVTLNNNSEIGKLNVYFITNFCINITYNNEIDKIFFENVFMNYRYDLEECKLRKTLY